MASKRSNVWKYFDQVSECGVECKLCQMKLVYHKSTSSMLNHLKLKHKTFSLEPESERHEQPLITSFTSARRHCDPARRERITALITRMITKRHATTELR
ncbi:Zinc finger BED domain containing protein 3 [Dissostichus eleginoides]|uniref:Zinc finger BED domain containing protein 3 n=1 Tax=Dissostichus eleginoides TaxID=100907 RepID=A0AAD9BLZ6_DISEL|nr:Zinc finger BED domain containing protein 3 [Dissostichus eleginoides]